MKVKVMRVRGEHRGDNLHGTRLPPKPEVVESEIQGWLDDNPDARIEHVTVAPEVHGFIRSGGGNIWPESVLVAIFYRD